MSNVNCCGINIAKSKFDCTIRPGDGKYKDKVFKNDVSGFISFISWITEQNPGPSFLYGSYGNLPGSIR